MSRTHHLRLLLLALAAVAGSLRVEAQLNSQEAKVASLLMHDAGQKRPFVQIDPILSRVARARAMDMAKRRYFSHTNPDGFGPNYLVRQAGYGLPSYYGQSNASNNLEAAAAGDPTAAEAWSGWMGSPLHKRQLLALDPFYVEQTSIGVGYCYDANSPYLHYWVVITAPPPGPVLNVSSPLANAALTTAEVALAGTTGGNPATVRVVYQVENSAGLGEAHDATGTVTYSASLTNLAPGPNTIHVRSLDAGGNVLQEVVRTFRYVVLKPLLVAVEGTGTITAGFLGTTQRELAAPLSITATPAIGWLFDHWSGSVDSTGATISFAMQEGFALTAHFRRDPFYVLNGNYNGLVQAGTAEHATTGLLKLSLLTTKAFTGSLNLGGKIYTFTGKFDEAGLSSVTVRRPPLEPLVLGLTLDLEGGTKRITGTVTDGTFTAALSADQALPLTGKHFAAGRYTVSLPPNPQDAGTEFPAGSGWSLLIVTPAGAATLTGVLADGRAFSASATVSKDGDLPIYVPLLLGTGSLAGHASFDPETGALDGSALWTKPARLAERCLPAAFATKVGVVGARYTAPKLGVPALTVAATLENSTVELTGGELPGAVRQSATLRPTNIVAIVNPQLPRLAVSITASNGRVTGSFTHPVTKALSRIDGVILQDRNAAFGFFLGKSASGAATFAPAP
jgi:hypothetical protein